MQPASETSAKGDVPWSAEHCSARFAGLSRGAMLRAPRKSDFCRRSRFGVVMMALRAGTRRVAAQFWIFKLMRGGGSRPRDKLSRRAFSELGFRGVLSRSFRALAFVGRRPKASPALRDQPWALLFRPFGPGRLKSHEARFKPICTGLCLCFPPLRLVF